MIGSQSTLGIALRGLAMGIAEAIPGVSGGTIAFVTGIYERLLLAISSVDLNCIRLLFTGKWKQLWTKIDGGFLLALGGGMVLGIGVSVFTITELLERFPEYLWAFFFGLIAASAVYIASTVSSWKASHILLLLAGMAIALLVCTLSPVQGSSHPLYLIICGMIAISALILPGVSGSFMLLILGLYATVLGALRGFVETQEMEQLQIIIFFAIGCSLGLVIFSRVVSWAFQKYRDPMLALMTGFVIGSLYKIWPWRNAVFLMNDAGEELPYTVGIASTELAEMKVLSEKLVLPADYLMGSPTTLLVVLCAIAGAAVVFFMSRKA